MTNAERNVAALRQLGAREIITGSKKFRVFLDPREGAREGDFFFVGKCGALRVGRTIRDSIPSSARFLRLAAVRVSAREEV